MNEIIPETLMLEHIRRYVDFTEIHPILKGYSSDMKYLLITKTGEKYLARITESADIKVLITRHDEFDLVRKLKSYSHLVSDAYYFWFADYARSCVMILEYADGDDAEQSLSTLSAENQYAVGYQAGEELKKLHGLAAPPGIQPWYHLKRRKYEWYRGEFQRMSKKPVGIDLGIVETFIKGKMHLMEGVSQTFQHDDYHPANLILKNGNLNGIIDFNRCDWGDPIHDFYKIAYFTRSISVPFARGQVDGYFQDEIPSDFWDRYALYSAMSIIPDLVWSGRYESRTGSDREAQKSMNRVRTVIADHDGFQSSIPRWYSKGE